MRCIEIITEKYRPLITKLIKEFGNKTIDFKIIDSDSFEKKRMQRCPKASPFMPAMADRDENTNKPVIFFKEQIDYSSSIDRIRSTKSETLITDEDCIRHLTLHEIAHIVNNWPQDKEDDCDEWAFTKMGIT